MPAVSNAPGAPPAPVAAREPSKLQKLASSKLVKKIAGTLLEDAAPRIEAALAKARTKIGAEPLFWLETLKIALNAVLDRVGKRVPKIAGALKLVVAGLTFLVGRETVQPVATLPVAAKPVPPPPPTTLVEAAKAPSVVAKAAAETVKKPVVKVTAATAKPVNAIKDAVGSALSKFKPRGK